MKKNIEKFEKLIKKAEKILLINHIRMDPDAFGSL
jgi:nanoRNase/pAp phosphatase (c-di-AMP/oligoRNAs hydrolase)